MMTGRSLKLLRISKSIPQWELAQKVKITASYLSAIENERVQLTDDIEFLLRKAIEEWKNE